MSRKLILILITSGFISLVLLNLALARGKYRKRARRHPDQPTFLRWWFKRSSIILYVFFSLYILASGAVVLPYYLAGGGQATILDLVPFLHRKGDSSLYLLKANRYIRESKYMEASLELRNAIKANPLDAETYIRLARCYWQMGALTEARTTFRQAAQVDPQLSLAHLELGDLSFVMGETQTAITEAEQALTLSPQAPEPRQLLAHIYSGTGRMDKAAEQYRAILNATPANDAVRKQLLDLLLFKGAFGEAVREAMAGLRQKPEDTDLQVALALSLEGQGQRAEAVATLRAAASRDGFSPLPYIALGNIMYRNGEYLLALPYFEEAVRRNPRLTVVMNNIAMIHAEHGYDLAKAAQMASRLYAQHPSEPAVVDTMGWVFFKLGHLEQALPLLQQAASMEPGVPEVHYHYGAALLAAGQTAAGRKELETALRISNKFDGAAAAQGLLRVRN